jgi:XapX domain-containing protein
MKTYLVSLALGLLVGVIYALFQVRSPAPPVIALVGLLGILLGEQIPPLVKQAFDRQSAVSGAWLNQQVKPHMFGELPKCTPRAGAAKAVDADAPARSDNA